MTIQDSEVPADGAENGVAQARNERDADDRSLTITFIVSQTPQEVFAAINDVRAWWSGDIEGNTNQLGDEWTYRYEDIHYSKQKITELIPSRKVVWLVQDSFLSFVKDTTEWNGTEIIFDVSAKGNETEVRFTHRGLVPVYECFSECSNAWGFYISGSLRNLISEGEGHPNH